MKAETIPGRALNVITNALASHTPLEVLMLKGCGQKTFLEIVSLMQRNGYWLQYDERGCPRDKGIKR